MRDFVRGFPKAYADVVRLLNRNRIFIDRTRGIGVLPKEDAINLSCTGPIARASGVVRDLRKDEPYLAYPDFDFKVVCADGGDCYARYLVRMEEMLESLKIVHQAIENLPAGPVNVDVEGKVVLPDKMCGLPQHRGPDPALRADHDQPPVGAAARRGVRGDRVAQRRAGLLHRGRRQRRAYRARTRPPSFIHFAIFPHLIVGHLLSDVVAVLGSLNIIAAELDR